MRRLAIVLLAATPGLAFAGDPKFEYGKAEEVKDLKDVEWKATAEGGVVFTTGNAETMTLTGGIKASRKQNNNKLAIEASAAYAKSNLMVLADQNGNGVIDDLSEIQTVDTVTAETLMSKLRYDRFLTELNSLFIAALASRDTPAGKDYVLGGQFGYSRSLRKTDTSLTLAELGYDFSREELIGAPAALEIHSARAFIGHKATMTEGTDLDTSIEVLTNLNKENLTTQTRDTRMPVDGSAFQDTRINARLAISAKIGANLAFQSAIEMKYDRRPGPLPVKNLAMGFTPEANRMDIVMRAAFIYTFAGKNK